MWILTKQLHTSAYAPDTRALDLDSEAFSQICEKSLSWRGKDSLSRTWLQRWKRENWMQRLCTRTLKPSHTESFVDAWTSSLVDSRANPSALLESVKLLKTQDTSSLTSQTELESANLELFSSKTYKESSVAPQVTENQFSNMSSEHWKKWVIEQRQEYSQRKKLAHLTNAKESTSWGTPQASDHIEGSRTKTTSNQKCLGRDLNELEEKKNWATPQVTDIRTDVRKPEERSDKANKGGCKNLREEVMQPQNWPTPTSAEGTKIGNQPNYGQVALSNHPSIVGQPDRAKLNKSGKSQGSWSTPQARDWKGAEGRAYKGQTKDLPAQTEATGKLNPNWVEQLMGLPVGWTDLGSWETE